MKTLRMVFVLGFMLAAVGGRAVANELLTDSCFNDAPDSIDLRANSADQDWYESRQDEPSLVVLDRTMVGSNSTVKAKLSESRDHNAYLTQEFTFLQRQTLSAQWDIYVDSIVNLEDDPDRAGWMLIGDNIGTDPNGIGPNAEDSERFVYMGFYKKGGGTTGTMDLVARDRDDPWSKFTTVAKDLNLRQWYTIKVNLDLVNDTYDVYVDGRYKDTLTSRTAKNCVTHISFAQWNDGAGTFYVDNVIGSSDFNFYPTDGSSTRYTSGKIVRQWWLNIDGTAISNLTSDPRYPNDPDGTELIDQFEGPVNWADNYGTRLYGWLTPPITGDYTFWISGDDEQELYLSTDADPANVLLIAQVYDWTNLHEWDKYPEQTSMPIYLQAGQKYYIEALGKEGSGDDSTSVYWQPPEGVQEIIPGTFVDAYGVPPSTEINSYPANGALDSAQQSPILSWLPAQDAVFYNVYFGSSIEAVANRDSSTFLTETEITNFNLDPLGWDQTFYWVTDATQNDGTILEGEVRSFTTASFYQMDDFESYLIAEGLQDKWSVGDESRTALSTEQSIVYSGALSMALTYYNLAPTDFSEARRAFSITEQDLTINDGDTLSLRVRGNANNSPQNLYTELVNIVDGERISSRVTHPNPNLVKSTEWTEWRIPLDAFRPIVDVTDVKTMIVGVENPETTDGILLEKPLEIKASPIVVAQDQKGKIYFDCIRIINLSGADLPIGFWGYVCDASKSGKVGIPNATIEFWTGNKKVAENQHPQPKPGEYYLSVPDNQTYTVKVAANGYEEGSFTLDIKGTDNNGKVDMTIETLRWVTCDRFDSGVSGCSANGLDAYLIPIVN